MSKQSLLCPTYKPGRASYDFLISDYQELVPMLPQKSSAADVIESEETARDPWLLERLHSRLKEVGVSICTYLS